MITMQFFSSFYLVLLLFSINFGSSVDAVHCKNDTQCTVTHRICALCVINNYPSCTTPICIDKQCGVLGPCSLKLSETCTTDNDCRIDPLCRKCEEHKGPSCTTPICIYQQCAFISPCTIPLQH
jgi:hypothetical protein